MKNEMSFYEKTINFLDNKLVVFIVGLFMGAFLPAATYFYIENPKQEIAIKEELLRFEEETIELREINKLFEQYNDYLNRKIVNEKENLEIENTIFEYITKNIKMKINNTTIMKWYTDRIFQVCELKGKFEATKAKKNDTSEFIRTSSELCDIEIKIINTLFDEYVKKYNKEEIYSGTFYLEWNKIMQQKMIVTEKWKNQSKLLKGENMQREKYTKIESEKILNNIRESGLKDKFSLLSMILIEFAILFLVFIVVSNIRNKK